MIQYKEYTVKDIENWLFRGEYNGLNEHIISKVRANAIIHNPFVDDNMVVSVCACDGDYVVGFAAQFPSNLAYPDVEIMCTTTLWVDPKCTEDFVGFELCKRMKESTKRGTIGINSVRASVLIDRLLGLKSTCASCTRFILRNHLSISGIRSLGSYILEPYREYNQRKNVEHLENELTGVYLDYCSFVDADTYDFMKKHSLGDMMLPKREMFDWLLQYPFVVESLFDCKVDSVNEFDPHQAVLHSYCVKVYKGSLLVGTYALRQHSNYVAVRWLYYDSFNKDVVFATLMQHVMKAHPDIFRSIYPELTNYINSRGLALRDYPEKYSFTYPAELGLDISKAHQGCDGDLFT